MNKVKKPMTVAREDFFNSAITLINESDLPAFVLEPILQNLLNDVRNIMKEQYLKDLEQYETELKSAENNDKQSVDE